MERWELTRVADLLRWEQDGVVSRAQLLAHGATPADVRRLLRRRELTVVHPGVYVNHTGGLTRAQREWAAVLLHWPAALAGTSALPGAVGDVVHVAVAATQRGGVAPGIVVTRRRDFAAAVDHRRRPPRVRLEWALLDVASQRLRDGDVADAYAVLSRAIGSRDTTPALMQQALAQRPQLTGRAEIGEMLRDLRDGACSVLERGYLRHVERAHGLPAGVRQSRSSATGRTTLLDVEYLAQGVVVELDGHAFHGSAAARDRDALRDLAELAATDSITVRLTYGLVFRQPCRTAALVGDVLRTRGWTGRPAPCRRADCVRWVSPDDTQRTHREVS